MLYLYLSCRLRLRRIVYLLLAGSAVVGVTSIPQHLKAASAEQATVPVQAPPAVIALKETPPVPDGATRFGGQVVEASADSAIGDPRPITDATILLCRVIPSPWYAGTSTIDVIQTISVNAEGHFEGFIPPTETAQVGLTDWSQPYLALLVTAPGFADDSLIGLEKDWNDAMRFSLIPGRTITGHIVDLEGQPVEGVRISVRQNARAKSSEVVDAWLNKASREPLKMDENERNSTTSATQMRDPWETGKLYSGPTSCFLQRPVTNKEGQFTLNSVGADDLLLLDLEGGGVAKSTLRVLGRDSETVYGWHKTLISDGGPFYGRNFTCVASPSVPVFGVISDKDTKAPLAGVTVAVHQVYGATKAHLGYLVTTTDAAGKYRIEGLPIVPSDIKRVKGNLLAVRPMRMPYLTNDFVAIPATQDPRHAIEFNLDLKRAVMARGRIINKSTGEAVQGGLYYLPFNTNTHIEEYQIAADRMGQFMGALGPSLYHTDANGQFEIPVIAGRGILAAKCDLGDLRPGHGAAEIPELQNPEQGRRPVQKGVLILSFLHSLKAIDVPDDASEFQVDLQVDPGNSMTIHLVDADGKPVEQVEALGLTSNHRFVNVKQSAATATGLAPGEVRPMEFANRKLDLYRIVRLIPEPTQTEFTVRLLPPTRLIGRLVDPNGKPLSEIRMEARYQIDPEVGSRVKTAQPSDADGRFEWKLPVGTAYTIVCQNDNNSIIKKDLEVEQPQLIDLGDLIVDPDAKRWTLAKPKQEPVVKDLP